MPYEKDYELKIEKSLDENKKQPRIVSRYFLAALAEILIVVSAYFAYMVSRNFVFQDTFRSVAFVNAENLIELRVRLHLLFEPVVQSWLVDNASWVAYTLNWVYILSFLPVIAITAVCYYCMQRSRYIFYRNVVLVTFVIALVVFMVFPLAPPRMMPQYGFIDTIDTLGPVFYNVRSTQPFYNAFAAMPSLHFGWALLLGIVYWTTGPGWLKFLGVIFPAITLAAIISTGNHYLEDAVVGALVIVVSTWMFMRYVALMCSRELRKDEEVIEPS